MAAIVETTGVCQHKLQHKANGHCQGVDGAAFELQCGPPKHKYCQIQPQVLEWLHEMLSLGDARLKANLIGLCPAEQALRVERIRACANRTHMAMIFGPCLPCLICRAATHNTGAKPTTNTAVEQPGCCSGSQTHQYNVCKPRIQPRLLHAPLTECIAFHSRQKETANRQPRIAKSMRSATHMLRPATQCNDPFETGAFNPNNPTWPTAPVTNPHYLHKKTRHP